MSPSMDAPANGEFAHELKFAIDAHQLPAVLSWGRANMAPDPHGSGAAGDSYRISTIYFETPELDVFHGLGSFARSKYRVRRYGSSSTAFVERKLKVGSRVTKRRSMLSLSDLAANNPSPAWFFRRVALRNLRPVCQLSYQRVARIATVDGSLVRFTIDRNIEAMRAGGLCFSNRRGVSLSDRQLIVELKFRHKLPGLFEDFIDSFGLRPQACSKYKLAAPALGISETSSAHENVQVAC